jgi:hypothetical protein
VLDRISSKLAIFKLNSDECSVYILGSIFDADFRPLLDLPVDGAVDNNDDLASRYLLEVTRDAPPTQPAPSSRQRPAW